MNDLERIYEKLDKIDDRLSSVERIMAVNTAQLEIHIEGVRLAREQNDIIRDDVEQRLQPLEKRASIGDAALKIAGGAAGFVAVAASLIKIVEYFSR